MYVSQDALYKRWRGGSSLLYSRAHPCILSLNLGLLYGTSPYLWSLVYSMAYPLINYIWFTLWHIAFSVILGLLYDPSPISHPWFTLWHIRLIMNLGLLSGSFPVSHSWFTVRPITLSIILYLFYDSFAHQWSLLYSMSHPFIGMYWRLALLFFINCLRLYH